MKSGCLERFHLVEAEDCSFESEKKLWLQSGIDERRRSLQLAPHHWFMLMAWGFISRYERNTDQSQ